MLRGLAILFRLESFFERAMMGVAASLTKLVTGQMRSMLGVGEMIKPFSSITWLLVDDTVDGHVAIGGGWARQATSVGLSFLM